MRRVALLLLCPLVAIASATAAGAAQNPRFRYGTVTPTAYAKVQPGDVVVDGPREMDLTPDPENAAAVAAIHARGALALKYVQWYWQPNGRSYQGHDLGTQPDWAFCTSGTTPMTDAVGHPGETWTYVDVNERGVRNFLVGQLKHLRDLGYDGIFVDRGGAALNGPLTRVKSTCTADPIAKGRTLGWAYVGMLNQAKALGLKIGLNSSSLGEINTTAVGVAAMSTARYLLDEGGTQGGVARLRADATVAARFGATAWALLRPGAPNYGPRLAAAAQVPAVRLVRGVTDEEDAG